MRTSDPETVERATDNMADANGMFPIGPLQPGNLSREELWKKTSRGPEGLHPLSIATV